MGVMNLRKTSAVRLVATVCGWKNVDKIGACFKAWMKNVGKMDVDIGKKYT